MLESYYQDNELFKGTAWYYSRYRPAYPDQVFQLLKEKFNLNGSGCLLPLGCGPGDLAISLAKDFEKVVALDADADMLEEGRRKASESRVFNIQWVHVRAEEMPDDLGHFKLVTIGKAFHWMDQKVVLNSVKEELLLDGGIALIGETGRIWSGKEPWYAIVTKVIKKYLGEARRAGTGVVGFSGNSWEDVLKGSFSLVEFNHSITDRNIWDIDSLLGYLYSTSYCSKEMLGDRINDFERDLKDALLACNPANCFIEDIPIEVLMGWK